MWYLNNLKQIELNFKKNAILANKIQFMTPYSPRYIRHILQFMTPFNHL
jgi:hypothetical protein